MLISETKIVCADAMPCAADWPIPTFTASVASRGTSPFLHERKAEIELRHWRRHLPLGLNTTHV